MKSASLTLFGRTLGAAALASVFFLSTAAIDPPPLLAQDAEAPAGEDAPPDDDPAADAPEAQPTETKPAKPKRPDRNRRNDGEQGQPKADSGGNQPDADGANAEAEKQKQRDAERAKAEAEQGQVKEQRAKAAAQKAAADKAAAAEEAKAAAAEKAAAEKAQAEAEKAAAKKASDAERGAAEKAKADAEKAAEKAAAQKADAEKAAASKAKADAEKAAAEKADADAQKAAAAKAQADAEKAAAEKAKADADRAKAEADNAQPEAAGQKAVDEEKAKAEAAKAKADAAKQKQLDAEKAKGESGADEQKGPGSDKAKAEADKAKADADKAEADKAKAESDKRDAATKPPATDDDSAAADKAPPPVAEGEKRDGPGRQRDGARVPPRPEPANEMKAAEQLQQERTKADAEFEKAKRESEQAVAAPGEREGAPAANRERRRAGADDEFQQLRKQRRERVEDGGRRAIIEEPDKRVIILEKDRAIVRHDETRRFGRVGKKEVKRERQKDGTTLSIYLSFDGVEIITVEDEYGHVLRRSRRGRDGAEIVLIDNRRFYSSRPRQRYGDAYVDLAPPTLRIPQDKYVVEYDGASEEDVYEALSAPPVERLERGYAMEEVRESRWLRARMRRVDLDAINFAFGSWEVEESEYGKLENIANAMKRILKRNPDEVFLIEGHTDAVGSDIDNLSLSDRRGEAVAIILSDAFRVPPENLTTQGYGEQYLKVQTDGPSLANRRVAVRRITPLLSRSEGERLSE